MRQIGFMFILSFVFLSACAIKKMKAFSECDFRLEKVNKVTVAGVNIDPTGNKKMNFTEVLSIAASLGQKKLPVFLDLNIEGNNPNSIDAKMTKFDWKIKIKDDEALQGTSNNNIIIPATSTSDFNFSTTFDLFPTVNKYNIDQLRDILNNAFDSEGNPKDIRFFLKPYLTIGSVNIPYPAFIEVSKYYKSQ